MCEACMGLSEEVREGGRKGLFGVGGGEMALERKCGVGGREMVLERKCGAQLQGLLDFLWGTVGSH